MAEHLFSSIQVPSGDIFEILRIATNIVVSAASDATLRVIDPIGKKSYYIFTKNTKTAMSLVKLA